MDFKDIDIFNTPLFKRQRERAFRKFNVDIYNFIKDSTQSIDFSTFENTVLTSKQLRILQDIQQNKYKKIILSGGIGSGKTFLACYLFIKSLIQHKHLYTEDTNNFIVGDCMDSIKLNTLSQISKICKLLKIDYVPKKPNNIECKIDGMSVSVYGGRDSDAFSKIRGTNTSLIYVNEATLINKEALFEVLRRLRHAQETAIFDTNPDHPEHYFKKECVDNTKEFKTYNFTIYDNPHLSLSYIESQENIYARHPETRQRMLMGEWVSATECIFSHIKRADWFNFVQPIMYIDPAFSVGDKSDNTAFCIMEKVDDLYYCHIEQYKEPVYNTLSKIQEAISTLGVVVVYVEDRDSIKGHGYLTKLLVQMSMQIETTFSIVPVRPISKKHLRINTLILPIHNEKIILLSQSTPSVFADIHTYKNDNKVNDDALDAMSACYLFLNNNIKKTEYFTIGNML